MCAAELFFGAVLASLPASPSFEKGVWMPDCCPPALQSPGTLPADLLGI